MPRILSSPHPTDLIELSVSSKDLTFKSGSPTSFTVTVINNSDRFATFQLEVLAAGNDEAIAPRWYKLSPEVSTKSPPGDTTEFCVTLTDTPVPGFVGMMNLTVRVFSMELQTEQREVLRLTIEQGIGAVALEAMLPVREFSVYPGNRLEIPLEVRNPTRQSIQAQIKIDGLPKNWFTSNNAEQSPILPPGQWQNLYFSGQLPEITQTLGQRYPFSIDVAHADGPTITVRGTMEVLPMGFVQLEVTPTEQSIPARKAWLPGTDETAAVYALHFENRSNLAQTVHAALQEESVKLEGCDLAIESATTLAPGQARSLNLTARARRPWLGLARRLRFDVAGTLADQRLELRDAEQSLALKVHPRIPLWLQASGGLLALLLAGWFWNVRSHPIRHTRAVNSVQLSGLADRVVSASNDQTVRAWRVDGQRLEPVGRPLTAGKAVRTVQFRPVNNNAIALGLENGEIQVWDLLSRSPQPLRSFVYNADDRVLDLAFTRDSNYLFSGHGSGLVLQWDLERTAGHTTDPSVPLLKRQMDFAVYDLTFVDREEKVLAIAGRFNRLVLWNREKNTLTTLPFPPGGQDDYITSLATAENNPSLLATADTQGRVTLWNLRRCLDGSDSCNLMDQWMEGKNGAPVRSVALSANGCYLTTTGDNGQVNLWPLTASGKRISTRPDQQSFAVKNTALNSVDVTQVSNELLVVTGADDHQVRLNRLDAPPTSCNLE